MSLGLPGFGSFEWDEPRGFGLAWLAGRLVYGDIEQQTDAPAQIAARSEVKSTRPGRWRWTLFFATPPRNRLACHFRYN